MGSGAGKSGAGERRSAGESGLNQLMTQLMSESGPLRKEVLGQTLEALETGGIGARLPIAQKGVEASRAATNQALRGTEENLARSSNLRDSSFGRTLLANESLEGKLRTAAIPQDIAMQFIGVAPTLTTGFSGQAIQAGTGAGSLFNQRQGIIAQSDIAKGKEQSSYISSIASLAAIAT